jgi:hypothetical protein
MIKNILDLFKKKKPTQSVESKSILLRVAGISYSKVENIYVLILEEVIPNWSDLANPPPNARRVTIIINFFEAQVIAVELEKIRPSILLIYDVVRDLINVFKIKIEKIIINSLISGEISAKLVCKDKKNTRLDIRPSDAIALSVRLNIPIYIEDNLLTTINTLLNEKFDIKHMDEIEKLENYSLQDLKSFLQNAIEKEDYENASRIRDEISRKTKSE